MTIKFSILIPAYKSKFLKECLDSILNQSYDNFEIIIVNDASPENIDNIISNYSDKRIQYYVNKTNIGPVDVVKNWNKCLEYSTGEYVICMGDDDRLKPNCLEEYFSLIKQFPEIGLLHGWTEIINEDSKVIALTTHRCEKESAMSLLWHRVFSYHSQFIGDFCYKANLLKEKGGFKYFPLAWGSDDVSAILAAEKYGVVNTQNVVFQYRSNSQTITSSGNVLIKIQATNLVEEWVVSYLSNPCDNNYDELYRLELQKEIPHYYQKKKSAMLISDFKKKSVLRVLFWLKNSKKYNLQKSTVLFSFVRSWL